jgi:hypothetical protein
MVKKCRSIASEIISSIQREWFPIQQAVRNSIWFMFNACMVPLLSLLSDPSHEDAELWRMDVELEPCYRADSGGHQCNL